MLRSSRYAVRAARSKTGRRWGLLSPAIYTAIVEEPAPQPFDLGPLNGLIGYLVGAVLAKVVLKRTKA